jgi:hypothetical protein
MAPEKGNQRGKAQDDRSEVEVDFPSENPVFSAVPEDQPPVNPIQVRYRAAPHPVAVSKPADRLKNIIPSTAPNQCPTAVFRFSEHGTPRPRTLSVSSPCPPLLSTA